MKKREKKPIVGVLLGEADTPGKAKSISGFLNKCPYCVSCTNVECLVTGVLSIPQHHRWWLESISKKPEETVGLKKAEVFFAEHVAASSPWSSGSVQPRLAKAPCGADCQGCPMYRKKCTGCPATTYYVD